MGRYKSRSDHGYEPAACGSQDPRLPPAGGGGVVVLNRMLLAGTGRRHSVRRHFRVHRISSPGLGVIRPPSVVHNAYSGGGSHSPPSAGSPLRAGLTRPESPLHCQQRGVEIMFLACLRPARLSSRSTSPSAPLDGAPGACGSVAQSSWMDNVAPHPARQEVLGPQVPRPGPPSSMTTRQPGASGSAQLRTRTLTGRRNAKRTGDAPDLEATAARLMR